MTSQVKSVKNIGNEDMFTIRWLAASRKIKMYSILAKELVNEDLRNVRVLRLYLVHLKFKLGHKGPTRKREQEHEFPDHFFFFYI